MSNIKKFSDFFAVFGAFSAAMYLVMQFMPFKPLIEGVAENEASIFQKLKAFFSPELKTDYLNFLVLFLLFALCFILSKLLPRLSSLHVALSLLPLGWSFFMFDYLHVLYEGTALTNKFKEHPLLFLICAVLYTAGAFADCLIADRKNETRRAPRASLTCTGVLTLLSLVIFLYALPFSDQSPEELFYLKGAIASAWETKNAFLPYLWIALMYAVLFAISFLLKNLYFVDFIVSLIPTCYVLLLWNSDDLPVFGAGIAILSITAALCRLLLAFLAKPTLEDTSFRESVDNLIQKIKNLRHRVKR